MTRKPRLATLLASVMGVTTAIATCAGIARANDADWDKDWTALTLSSNGAWGSSTHTSRTTAMMQAIAQCRERSGEAGGCGSHTATVRGAWIVAYACGGENFIVTARSFPEAHAAGVNQEIELRDFERVEMGECRRLVAIGPDGAPAAAGTISEVLPLIPEGSTAAAPDNMH